MNARAGCASYPPEPISRDLAEPEITEPEIPEAEITEPEILEEGP